MIYLPINVREEFTDKIKNFCSSNNISWGAGFSECLLEGVSGTPEQVESVRLYVEKLENKRIQYRSLKGFWWRIWN